MKNKIFILFLISNLSFAGTVKAQTVPPYVPTAGLLGWYPFNGNANDESGNGHHSTTYNGPVSSADRFGNKQSSYLLDGIDDYIKTNESFYNSSLPHTVSLWWKTTDSTKVDQAFWNTEPHTIEVFSFNSWFHPGQQKIDYCLGDGNWGQWLVTCPGTPITVKNFNNWHHFVMVRSNTNWKFYDNGVLVQTVTFANNTGNTIAKLWFGAIFHDNYSEHYFKGNLDDIGIWNRALTETEISSIYNACTLSISTQPLNQNVALGSTVHFIVASSEALSTYQWQTDLGLGFQNLSNAGQYSGVTTNTLTVSGVTINNNGQLFRCIVAAGTCKDTTSVAKLTVMSNVGIEEGTGSNHFRVYPNPTNNTIHIEISEELIGTTYTISDQLGKIIMVDKLHAENTIVDFGKLAKGIYTLRLDAIPKHAFKVIKN